MINTLREKYNSNTFHNSYEMNPKVAVTETILGITLLQRHLTLYQKMYNSDQPSSIYPNLIHELVLELRNIEKSKHNEIKTIFEGEEIL